MADTRVSAGVFLLVLGCGSRSGLPISEADAPDSGPTSPNPLCATHPPGEVVTLLSGDMQPANIGVSGEWLFVAEWPFTGDVFRMSRAGGPVAKVLSDDEPAVNQLVTDGKAAYWVVQGLGGNDGALRTGASSATTLVGSLTRPQGVARFGDSLYFTDGYGPPNDAVNGRVQRLELGTGNPSTLASGLGDPWAIAVDATGVYFTDGSTLFSLPHGGGEPNALAQGSGFIQHLATNGTSSFWSDGSALHRREHATGLTVEVATGLGLIEGIAADERGAFFVERSAPSDQATGGVFEVLEDGVELLATTEEAPLGLAIDASAVYFVTLHGAMGSVNMLCRRPQRSP